MATIICDFDDVLFDASSFKESFFQFLERLSVVDPQSSYMEAGSAGYYNATRHMVLLAKGNAATVRALKRQTMAWIRRSAAPYLFPDTRSFLRQLQESGHAIFILTKGTVWFQGAKIQGCGLNALQQRMYIVEEATKTAACTLLMDAHKGPFVLLEDTPSEIEELKRAFPAITAIHVTRGREQPVVSIADYRITDLNEALSIIALYNE